MRFGRFLRRYFVDELSEVGAFLAVLLLSGSIVGIAYLSSSPWVQRSLAAVSFVAAFVVYVGLARFQARMELRERRAARYAGVREIRVAAEEARRKLAKDTLTQAQREEEERQRLQREERVKSLKDYAEQGLLPTSLPIWDDFGLSPDDVEIAQRAQKRLESRSYWVGQVFAFTVLSTVAIVILGGLYWARASTMAFIVAIFLFVCYFKPFRDYLSSKITLDVHVLSRWLRIGEADILDRYGEFLQLTSAFERIIANDRLKEDERRHSEEREKQAAVEAERRAEEERLLELQRRDREYWKGLTGRQFELELGELYRKQGYNVHVTPVGVDGGIDIELRRGEDFIVVQCKSQKKPVGRQIAQQLYGVMHAVGANGCVLACTGGFNRNVRRFAEKKPFELIGIDEILEMGRRADPQYDRRTYDCNRPRDLFSADE
jgi:hypothetical protein